MTFRSLPFTVRTLRASEAILERIYQSAFLGLKGDSLALAAGLLPVEYNRLLELDDIAKLAEQKGRADSEREASQHLLDAARGGDAKAALEILRHTHGWVAKQAVSIEIDQRISITDALREAERRVIDGVATLTALDAPLTAAPENTAALPDRRPQPAPPTPVERREQHPCP